MEREHAFENDRRRTLDDGPAGGDNLAQDRAEAEGMLQTADRLFDSIKNPQQYLHQNLQRGGQ